jgi:hypothetical protein
MSDKKPVVVVDNYKIDESLTELDNLALEISPVQELEQKVDLVNNIESLAVLTKQKLALKREEVQLEVDNKKLDTAKKTIGAVEKIIDAVLTKDVLERVSLNIKTPMDMKFMAEAADKLASTLKNLMSGSAVDEMGNKKKQKINFMFKSTGTVQGAIQIDNSEDD